MRRMYERQREEGYREQHRQGAAKADLPNRCCETSKHRGIKVSCRVSRLYRKAMELTSRVKEMEIPNLDLPQSPLGLSYMVSYVLDLKAERKQELLEIPSPFFRLTALVDDLENIILQLEQQVSLQGKAYKAGNNGHLRKSP